MVADPTTIARLRRSHDVAYLCFLPPAVISLVSGLSFFFAVSVTTAAGLGFFVLLPLALVALASVPRGLYLSVKLRTDAVLPVLSVLTFLLIAEVATEAGSATFYNASTFAYGIVVSALEALWFMYRRSHAYHGQ